MRQRYLRCIVVTGPGADWGRTDTVQLICQEAKAGVIRKRRWKQHQHCVTGICRKAGIRVDQGRKTLKDGHRGLAERPKVAGAQAVAAGSNNDDVQAERSRAEQRGGVSQSGVRKRRSSADCVHRRESVRANVDRAVSSVIFERRAQILETVVPKAPLRKRFKDEAC